MKFVMIDPFTKEKVMMSVKEFDRIYNKELELNENIELKFNETDDGNVEVVGIVEYFRVKVNQTKEFKEIVKLIKELAKKFGMDTDDLKDEIFDKFD